MSLKLATFAAALAGASAFVAPNQMGVAKSSSAVKMGFESEIGVQAPLGFWDPLGMLDGADQARFDRLRTVEIKHGRIAMLAVLGHLVTTAGYRFPFTYDLAGHKYADVPTGIKALTTLPFAGVLQTIVFIGAIEAGYARIKPTLEAECDAKMASLGWNADRKKAIELNNGRAAQMGILGLAVHEMIDGNPYVLNSLLGAPVDFNAGF
ncbi:unnamed protein product [Heterosigma akashiwo]|eukprot:CAMPEP_0194563806 /NCGR_PEP_ID=MMETSP0292-20121207/3718_1 /TAXON_ID=39354 /ORGANISM="Heterosigma akashiwo, Strain CCMP2393" /LENGTH=207 /DNA_ID=CAMNT_0039412817 /DNA_START=196 /DNA_END=819 /DNA_ORIENTATION=-